MGQVPAAVPALPAPSVLAVVWALVALMALAMAVQARFALQVSPLAAQAPTAPMRLVSVQSRSVVARAWAVTPTPHALQPALPEPGLARQAVSAQLRSAAFSARQPAQFSSVDQAVPQRS
jgi:hypothetical protein